MSWGGGDEFAEFQFCWDLGDAAAGLSQDSVGMQDNGKISSTLRPTQRTSTV